MADYFIGLTGGIASGKSTVERLFARRGIVVADADLIAREIVEPGQPALAAVVERFGSGVLDAAGQLDRPALRRQVFEDPAARRDLEAILHPAIRQLIQHRCVQAEGPYALATIPLLIEGGGRAAYPRLDRIVVVDVPVELQLQRLLARDGIDETLAQRMIAAQASRNERLAHADDIIANTGTLADVEAVVETLDRRYRALAAS